MQEPNNLIIRLIGIGESGGKLIQKMIRNPAENVFYIAIDYNEQRLSKVMTHHKLLVTSAEQQQKAIELLKSVDFLLIYVDIENEEDFNIAQALIQTSNNTLVVIATQYLQENTQIIERTKKLHTDHSCIVHFDLQKECEIYQLAEQEAKNHLEQRLIQFSHLPNIVSCPGFINIDIQDVCSILWGANNAFFIMASASGKNRAELIIKKFIELAKFRHFFQVNAVLIDIQSGLNLELNEINLILDGIHSISNEAGTIIFGTSISESDSETLTVMGIFACFC
ncbi:hypothetical protein appser11_3590 [Actinobacillus pleuropneumoniae serovar 11 str. 56153]|uniref:Cell division protein FtsZ n=3 Tax=Actinobacillus pleuropneumoniae TaxID=715 RepID=A0ABM6X5M5_ACTPL|nr:cell division protein FtsZ [Actinobacillus pleuropneumoniae serovar 1 str. 4074]AXA22526.1 cell division protein FtsZ [Actinobacillus pleuropneumoniae]EFM99205.1 hypothetical protein appser11_3590 [Actinobacillus pleuropneumoniae serovar 11 str. 56153]UKH35990.1 cell division protein FtsZ [Actinobacillus pleuropneumoniae serovar 9 str. CVJ13261]MBL4536722.1 cell division protein FtsZ [Actinobacillus pleuropneumoniae]